MRRLSNFVAKTNIMKLRTLTLSFVLSVLFPLFCNGERSETFIVYLSGDPVPTEVDPRPSKKRSGGQQIPCEITLNGISISGMDTSDIYLFELRTENGELLNSFVSEHEFITYLYTLDETVEIRLYFEDFVLGGFLHL